MGDQIVIFGLIEERIMYDLPAEVHHVESVTMSLKLKVAREVERKLVVGLDESRLLHPDQCRRISN